MSMVRNRADAEEIMQEAMCRMIARFRTFSTTESGLPATEKFPAMFFVTVRNLCIDLTRKRDSRRTVSIENRPIVAEWRESKTAAKQHASEQYVHLQQTINRLVDALPEDWREALKLKTSGGLSYAEIAEVLEATHAQVRTWIFRARRKLESELRDLDLM